MNKQRIDSIRTLVVTAALALNGITACKLAGTGSSLKDDEIPASEALATEPRPDDPLDAAFSHCVVWRRAEAKGKGESYLHDEKSKLSEDTYLEHWRSACGAAKGRFDRDLAKQRAECAKSGRQLVTRGYPVAQADDVAKFGSYVTSCAVWQPFLCVEACDEAAEVAATAP